MPFFLVCRKMLDSPRFSEAAKALLNAKRSVSYNVMLAGEGVVVDFEAHLDDVSFIYPKDAYWLIPTTSSVIGRFRSWIISC